MTFKISAAKCRRRLYDLTSFPYAWKTTTQFVHLGFLSVSPYIYALYFYQGVSFSEELNLMGDKVEKPISPMNASHTSRPFSSAYRAFLQPLLTAIAYMVRGSVRFEWRDNYARGIFLYDQ